MENIEYNTYIIIIIGGQVVPEYQRLVSYIYLYDKGIKVKNSGFAKIECKDNILRIKMNLKGAFNNYYDQWKVYLLVEENKEILGIYVGEMKGKGTSAEFQMISSADNIGETTKSFDDLKGLAVISAGVKRYATFWKDTDITIENFKKYEEKESARKDTIFGKKKDDTIDIYQSELLKAMSVGLKENKVDKEKVQEKQAEKQGGKIEEIKVEEIKQQEFETKKDTLQDKNIIKEELEEVNLNENWNKFLEQYQRIHPFADKNEMQCIKIELKDLKILPKSQWILSSNSFVLHGYYNYQYLILGKINNKFILGVPGVFCNKEKLVAGIFGFDDFKPAQVSECKTGRFGYWYKYL